MEICQSNNFPHPQTIHLNKRNIEDIESTIFPAILKPNYTTGGRGMSFVQNLKDLSSILDSTIDQYGECHLQKFIEPGGKQIKVQLFMNRKSNLLFSSVMDKVRFYPENGGSSSCNITVNNKKVVKTCQQVLETIGWVGFADFDLIEDPKDGVIKILEINPRIPACIKSAIRSGIDYGNIIVNASLKREHKQYTYTPGQQLRHAGFEILWFLNSKNRFTTKPNWFRFFGNKLAYQDFSFKDPLPFLGGTFRNILKELDPKFRKSKSGLKP